MKFKSRRYPSKQGRHRLCRRADTEERVVGHGGAASPVTDAKGLLMENAGAVNDGNGGADHAEGRHRRLHVSVERLPLRGKCGGARALKAASRGTAPAVTPIDLMQ